MKGTIVRTSYTITVPTPRSAPPLMRARERYQESIMRDERVPDHAKRRARGRWEHYQRHRRYMGYRSFFNVKPTT